MEPLEDFFSSPGKSDLEERHEDGAGSEGSGDEAMDISTSTAPSSIKRVKLFKG